MTTKKQKERKRQWYLKNREKILLKRKEQKNNKTVILGERSDNPKLQIPAVPFMSVLSTTAPLSQFKEQSYKDWEDNFISNHPEIKKVIWIEFKDNKEIAYVRYANGNRGTISLR